MRSRTGGCTACRRERRWKGEAALLVAIEVKRRGHNAVLAVIGGDRDSTASLSGLLRELTGKR